MRREFTATAPNRLWVTDLTFVQQTLTPGVSGSLPCVFFTRVPNRRMLKTIGTGTGYTPPTTPTNQPLTLTGPGTIDDLTIYTGYTTDESGFNAFFS